MTNIQDSELYTEYYRPFKNKIRNLNVYRSLYVIWAYSENIVHHVKFANDVIPVESFPNGTIWEKRRVLSEWQLEEIASEIIKFGTFDPSPKYQLENQKHTIMVVNKLKQLQDEIARLYITPQNIQQEFFRMAHKQFPYEVDFPNQASLVRYYKVYSDEKIQNLIKSRFGLSLDTIFRIAAVLWGFYLGKFSSTLPLRSTLKMISTEDAEKFLTHFSANINLIRKEIPAEPKIIEDYFYNLSVLRPFPLITVPFENQQFLTCPIPTLLIWRVTTALYYDLLMQDLKEHTDFGSLVGFSFQNYCGEVLAKTISNTKIKIFKEGFYKTSSGEKATIDWIVKDDKSALFIECKTKRITKTAKEELTPSKSYEKDLDVIADYFIQIYKSILDFNAGLYPNLKYDPTLRIYPILLTLENLYLMTDDTYNLLYSKLDAKLDILGLPKSLVAQYPITVCSISEFENLTHIINQIEITPIFIEKTKSTENQRIMLDTFLANNFAKEFNQRREPLFPNIFRQLFEQDK